MSHFVPFVINPDSAILEKNPLLSMLTEQLSQQYAQQTVTEISLKTIGLLLWHSLQIDEQFNQFYQKYHSVALVINSQHQHIHQLPWECLYHPIIGFLGKQGNFTLSRCLLKQDVKKCSTITSYPLQILLFSTPHADLQFEWEQHEVYQALREWIALGQVQLFICDSGSFTHFQALLQRQTWHLVLLSGHYLANINETDSFFIFENEQEQKEAIAATKLASLFQQVTCVVLLACQTAHFSFSHLAVRIAQMGVPHVIGMREKILDRAAIIFIKHFCINLLQQGRIDIAVQYGRQQMTDLLNRHEVWHDTHSYQGQWSLPTLLTSNPLAYLPVLRTLPTNHVIPLFWQYNVPEISVLIGHRKAVQHLLEVIKTTHYQKIIITGIGGIGKTALANHLVNRLNLEGYNIFACHSNTVHELTTELSKWLDTIRRQRGLLWLDHVKQTDYVAINAFFEQWADLSNLRVLMTSRYTFSISTDCYQYHLTQLDFENFVRYIRYLGLPYKIVQIRLLYKLLDGNFKAVQLLQTLPNQTVGSAFTQQLKRVQRYLQAYLRQET